MSTITLSAGEHAELWDAAEAGKRLAALVLEYTKPGPPLAQPEFDKMLILAHALVGDGAALTEVKHGMEHVARFGDEMPTAPGVYRDTGTDPVHPKFEKWPKYSPENVRSVA